VSHATTTLSLPCARPVTPGDKVSTPGDVASTPGGVVSTPGDVASTPGGVASTPGDVVSTPGGVVSTPGLPTPGDVVSTPGAGVNMSTNDDTNSVVAAAVLDLCSSESPLNVLYPSADNTKSNTPSLAGATGGAVEVSQMRVNSDSADVRHSVNSTSEKIAADIPAVSSSGQRTTTEPSDKSDIIHCQPSIASPPATTSGSAAASETLSVFNEPDYVANAPQVMTSKTPKCLSSKTQDIASNKVPVTSVEALGDVVLSPDTECVASNSSLSSLCVASSCMCGWSHYSVVHCQCEKCILLASLGHALQPYHLSSVPRCCDVGTYNGLRVGCGPNSDTGLRVSGGPNSDTGLRVSGGLRPNSALINNGLSYDSLCMCNTSATATATRYLYPYHNKPETSSLSAMSVNSAPSHTPRFTCSGVSCHCLQPQLQHVRDLQTSWWTVHNRNVNNSISSHHNMCPTVNNLSAPDTDRHLLHGDTDHLLDCVTAPTFWSYKTHKH
jgi:hypothetical protein